MPITLLPPWAAAYLLFVAALCGACAGSFLNCAALRYLTGEKLPRGRSHCPRCGHVLGLPDLVPLLSWLFLRGRCRHCGAPISPRYPLTEALGAAAWVTALARFGVSWQTVEHCLLFSILLTLALIDYDTMEIPDGLQLAGVVVFGVFLPTYAAPVARLRTGLLGALALGGSLLALSLVMDRVLGRESMGGGDIKLLAVLGLFAGPAVGLLLIIAACVMGLVFAALMGAKDKPFPFGPAIALAAWPTLLWGGSVVAWYWGLFV